MIDSQDVEEVKLLVRYAVHKGLKIDDKVVDGIAAASYKADAHAAVSAQEEARFWASASAVAEKIAPVTLSSIQCSLFTSTGGLSAGGRTARFYYWTGLAVFVCLVLSQGYWFILDSVIRNFKESQSIVKQYAAFEDSVALSSGERSAEDFDKALREAYVKNAEEERKAADQRGSGSSDAARIKTYLTFAGRAQAVESQRKNLDALGRLTWPAVWLVYPASESQERFYYNVTADDVRYMQGAQFVLDIFNRFLLPVLYGLLGACVFTVRDVTDSVNKVLYTREKNTVYQFRLFAGGVAGLAIAWFVVPKSANIQGVNFDPAGVLTNLPQLALSFVAGYAIEIFLSVIDRIVSAFTVSGKPSS
jgi:hypothetical protein